MLQTTDFDQLAHALRDWDARFQQLGRGPFDGRLHFLPAGAVQVFEVAVNRVIQVRGTLKPGCYGFSLITPANAASTWRGRRLKPGQINVNAPAAEMDHLSSAEYRTLAVTVDAETLRKKAEVLYGIDLEERLDRRPVLTVAPAAFARLADSLTQCLHGARSRALSSPSSPAQQRIEHVCIRQVLQALASTGALGELDESGAVIPSRLQIVRRAEAFMLANLDQLLLTEDVCAEVGVSERTLRYAFQDVFGVSPKAYFKTRKLNAVRHLLKQADPAAVTVHDIARQWGFAHTGNFAADYFHLFGERPSETLSESEA